MNARVVVVGDLVTDVVAVLGAPLAAGSEVPAGIRLTPGGQGGNTAAWLARRGLPVTLVSTVGDDPVGGELVGTLAARGVDCAVRQVVGAATGTLVVLVGPGEPTMVADRGAARHLSPADIDSALDRLDDVRHLHLSGYALFDGAPMAGRHALAAARDRGLTTSIDAASAAPLRRAGVAEFLEGSRGVDLLFANAVETTVLAESTADPMTQARALARILAGAGAGAGAAAGAGHPAGGHGGTGSPCAVVVKLGSAGALWASSDGRTARVNAAPAAAVDPTGAGDAFAAGVLAAWLSGADPVGSLRAGAELGAEAVSTIGPRPP